MKKKWGVVWLLTGAAITLFMTNGPAAAADKVVVIPLVSTKDDTNLLPENIKYNTEIFGVLGTYPDPSCMNQELTNCQIWCFINYGSTTNEGLVCMQGCQTMQLFYGSACL